MDGWRSKYDLSGELIGPQGGSVWLNRVPEGLFETVMWVSARYVQPTIVITENGCDMLGEDEPRSFDKSSFSFSMSDSKQESGGDSSSGGGQSLESLLRRESESNRALLMDDFRQVVWCISRLLSIFLV
jgi:hypothetical protein